jgi:hypothetical protein
MVAKQFWGIAILLVGPLCAGCATNSDVIRAQSPAGPESAMAYQQGAPMQGPMMQGGPMQAGPMQPGGEYGGACPECGCQDGTCGHRCCLPRHHLWSHYCPPQNCLHPDPLVYPPNPTPGAVVQYPYYTCKGPDDFFLQK